MAREARVLDVVDDIYSAALDGERWPGVLTALADLLGGVDATLEVHREVGARPLFFAAGDRLPQSGVEDYLGYYAHVCPRIPYFARLAAGSIGYDYDFMSDRDMDRDEFYADFLGPSDFRYFAGGILINRPGALGGVYVHRSKRQGHADEADLALLKRLVPHLARALDLHHRLERQCARDRGFLALIDRLPQAIVTLDGRGQVQFANDAAAEIAKQGDGVALNGRRLHVTDATANRCLSAALKHLLEGDPDAGFSTSSQLVARRPSGRAAYVLILHRLPGIQAIYEDAAAPAAAVFIYDPETPVRPHGAALAQAFSLTPREAELAVGLLQGRTLQEQAELRGVKISTERDHLKTLMQKTDTHRQADLVRLLTGFAVQIR